MKMNPYTSKATVYHTAGNSVIDGSDKSSEKLHKNILAQLLKVLQSILLNITLSY